MSQPPWTRGTRKRMRTCITACVPSACRYCTSTPAGETRSAALTWCNVVPRRTRRMKCERSRQTRPCVTARDRVIAGGRSDCCFTIIGTRLRARQQTYPLGVERAFLIFFFFSSSYRGVTRVLFRGENDNNERVTSLRGAFADVNIKTTSRHDHCVLKEWQPARERQYNHFTRV